MPKVSIIVPVYNVENYLSKCLDSLINQTLTDIEIICINDGSTDNSLKILEEYAHKDNRIVLINKNNEGQGIARNIGISMAKGEYIGFVDPDDWIDLQMYEKMYNQAKNINSEIVICNFSKIQECNNKSVNYHFLASANNSTQSEPIEFLPNINIEKSQILKILLVTPCYAWNRIYKTEMLKKNNICFATYKCYEDCMFILNSHILAKNISYVPDKYYNYLLREKSTVRSYENKYKDMLAVFEDIKIELQKLGYLNSDMKMNYRYFVTMNTWWTYSKLQKIKNKLLFYMKSKKYLSKEDRKIITKRVVSFELNKILSLKNSRDRRHKVLTVLGLKIKFKRKNAKQQDEIARLRRELERKDAMLMEQSRTIVMLYEKFAKYL